MLSNIRMRFWLILSSSPPPGHRSFFSVDIKEHIKEATNRASLKAMLRVSNSGPKHHSKSSRHHPYTRPDSHSEARQGGYRPKEQGSQLPFHEGRPGNQGKGRQPSKGKPQHKQHNKQDSSAPKEF